MSTIKETVWDGTRFLEIDAGTVDGKDAVEFEISDPEIQIHIKKAHAPSNAQKNSDITKAEIEAKLTGEINTHFHAPLDNTLEEAKIHMADSSIHVLSTDKTRWEDKYTKAEINTKFNVVEANNYWKPPVDTFASISTTYPTPADGWVVSVKDTKYTYRYDGAKWIPISANAIQNATSSVSGLMSNIDKSKLDNIEAEANKYIHPATHPPSIIAQDTNNRFMTDAEKTKLSGIATGANAYTHPTGDGSNHIPSGGTVGQVLKNTASGVATWQADNDTITTVNGKSGAISKADIVALGIPAQDTVYAHPATHPPSVIAQDTNNRFMTDAERTKLSEIAAGANNYVHPTTHPASIIIQDASNRFMTDAERTKLSGITAGANAYVHPSTHPPSIIVQDATNRFVTDAEKAAWNAKSDASSVYTKAETDTRIQNIVGAAPAALDTLKELGDALNNDPNFASTVTTELSKKVDKVEGKTLTTNDYTTAEKTKLENIAEGATLVANSATNGNITINGVQAAVYTHPAGTNPHGTTKADIGLGNVNDTSDLNKPISTATQTALNLKADKTQVLTNVPAGAKFTDTVYTHPATHPPSIIAQDADNRFMTDAERTKLSGIAAGANAYTHPATHPPSIIAQDASNRFMTDAERTKLSGIATGATLVANSATNGNITINGAQQIVYTHPAGTNPHATTKADIGLSLVDNIQQATKAEFNTHNADAVKHITAAERTAWNSQLSSSGGTVTGNVTYNENIYVKKDIALGANSSASIRYNETTKSLDFIFT